MAPKEVCTIATVSAVEQVIIAALNATTRIRVQPCLSLVIRRPENKPSKVATAMPASPPYNISTRKIKTSETVTLVLTRGICTESRELTSTIAAESNQNFKSTRGVDKTKGAQTNIVPPSVTIDHLYAFAKFSCRRNCAAASIAFRVTSSRWFDNRCG